MADFETRSAVIDVAENGNNTIVAAVPGKRIRVTSFLLVGAGSVTARFESGADGTALSGQMTMAAGSVVAMPYNEAGYFEAAENTLLNLELSGATSVDGCLTYRLV